MNAKTPYKVPTGTFTASVDGVQNFNADILYLTVGRSLAVVGIQDNQNSVVRTIETQLNPDIENGTYDFNSDSQIHMLGVIASSAPYFVTRSGSVTVNFDRANDHYQGGMEIDAEDIFTGRVIKVKAKFDLRGITPVLAQKHK